MIIRMMFNNDNNINISLLLFLITLRNKNNHIFSLIKNKQIQGERLIKKLIEDNPQFSIFFEEDGYVLYSILLSINCSEGEYKELREKEYSNETIKEMLNFEYRINQFSSLTFFCYKRVDKYLVKLDMIDKYV